MTPPYRGKHRRTTADEEAQDSGVSVPGDPATPSPSDDATADGPATGPNAPAGRRSAR
jgi:hypothetical protein